MSRKYGFKSANPAQYSCLLNDHEEYISKTTILIRLIAKRYAQIVSDVFVDVSDVSEVLLTGLSCLAIA